MIVVQQQPQRVEVNVYGEFTLAVTNFTSPARVEDTRKGFDKDELEAYALALVRLTDTEY